MFVCSPAVSLCFVFISAAKILHSLLLIYYLLRDFSFSQERAVAALFASVSGAECAGQARRILTPLKAPSSAPTASLLACLGSLMAPMGSLWSPEPQAAGLHQLSLAGYQHHPGHRSPDLKSPWQTSRLVFKAVDWEDFVVVWYTATFWLIVSLGWKFYNWAQCSLLTSEQRDVLIHWLKVVKWVGFQCKIKRLWFICLHSRVCASCVCIWERMFHFVCGEYLSDI